VYRRFGVNFPISGGGYFRLYPFWFSRRYLQKINEAGQPFMIYVHPWELDPEQPRLPASRSIQFRHYIGLSSTEQKLERLVRDCRFGALSDALVGRDDGVAPRSTARQEQEVQGLNA